MQRSVLALNCVWNSRAKGVEPNQIMEILPANHCYSSSQWKFSSWQAWLLWTRSNQLVLFPFLGSGAPIWTSRWHLIWLLQEFAHSKIIIWVGWLWYVYIAPKTSMFAVFRNRLPLIPKSRTRTIGTALAIKINWKYSLCILYLLTWLVLRWVVFDSQIEGQHN